VSFRGLGQGSRGFQRLVEIGQDVVDMLNADGETDIVVRNAGLQLLGRIELGVGGGRRMNGEAARIARDEMAADNERIRPMRDRLWSGLKSIGGVELNGDPERRIAGNLNVSFAGVDGESLIPALKDIAVSSGSACTSASLEPSYVLRALGRPDELAHASIRFTLGKYTTAEEVDYAVNLVRTQVPNLRAQTEIDVLNT